MSLCPFPTTITITPRAPPFFNLWSTIPDFSNLISYCVPLALLLVSDMSHLSILPKTAWDGISAILVMYSAGIWLERDTLEELSHSLILFCYHMFNISIESFWLDLFNIEQTYWGEFFLHCNLSFDLNFAGPLLFSRVCCSDRAYLLNSYFLLDMNWCYMML